VAVQSAPEPFVRSPTSSETKLDRPNRIERTVVERAEVSVDDLPTVDPTPRDSRRELREVFDLLRDRLRRVEAQVVSLSREISGSPRTADDDARARALVTSSIEEARAGLRAIDRCESRLGVERGPRTATPIPAW